MISPEFRQAIDEAATQLLLWVGFGTLVGLAAKAIMPGKDPGGSIGTFMMGIAGSVIGCGTLMFFYDGAQVTPISPLGFAVGTAGAFLILFFYRLLSGSLFGESEDGDRFMYWSHRRRRRRALLRD
ncbi:MAG: GlsB/YeaQ/YmgE family stress response membrane protein [Planctomycetota bacterium]